MVLSDRTLDITDEEALLALPPGGLILAVLGYSTRRGHELHPVCAARVDRAVEEADAADAVILSGWARRSHLPTEADLMRRAWRHRGTPVVLDAHASTTAESAARMAPFARAVEARELRVVTSGWHVRRATYLFRRALRDTQIHVTAAHADDRPTIAQSAREIASWMAVPIRAGRRGGSAQDAQGQIGRAAGTD